MVKLIKENVTTSTGQTIENLSPLTNYSFTVAAMTANGVGPYSDGFVQSTEEAG